MKAKQPNTINFIFVIFVLQFLIENVLGQVDVFQRVLLYIVADSFVEALEELDESMPDIYYDVLGCVESELPQLLRRQAL